MTVSCSDDEEPITRKHRVVIAYIIGENSLSEYLEDDFQEMTAGAGSIPDSCRMAVFFDNSRTDIRPKIVTIDAAKGQQVLYEYSNDPVSTDSTVMADALNLIIRRNPADHYGLILLSHGDGWLPSRRNIIGIDNGRNSRSNSGTTMEVTTLANILRQAGVQWDYVFFDACFMQCIEVDYELRDIVDWVIASPAEIPGAGAPYTKLMPALFADDYAQRIPKEYHDHYETSSRSKGIVISAVKSSEMDNLAAATAPLIAAKQAYDTQGIQTYCIYNAQTGWKPEYFDIGSTMGHWLSESDYTAWMEALNRAVPYRYLTQQWSTSYTTFDARITDAEHDVAMSMYIPIEGRNLNTSFTRTAWYRICGWQP